MYVHLVQLLHPVETRFICMQVDVSFLVKFLGTNHFGGEVWRVRLLPHHAGRRLFVLGFRLSFPGILYLWMYDFILSLAMLCCNLNGLLLFWDVCIDEYFVIGTPTQRVVKVMIMIIKCVWKLLQVVLNSGLEINLKIQEKLCPFFPRILKKKTKSWVIMS